MKLTLDEFLQKFNGQPVDFDGAYGLQCMDLMHQYVYSVLGLTDARILAAAYARYVYENFDSIYGRENFEKIPNTPTGVPKAGDIVLFGSPMGKFTDTNGKTQYAGHVCIFIEGDSKKFRSFDENYDAPLPHVVEHTYTYCLGWLRPKNTQPDTQAQLNQAIADRDRNWNFLIAISNALGVTTNIDVILAEIKKLISMEDSLNEKQKNLDKANEQITDLEGKLKPLQDTNDDLKTKNEKLSEDLDDQKKKVTGQNIDIENLKTQIIQFKESAKFTVFTGWKLNILKFLSSF